jgi:Tol biopolymer transport system component
MKRLFVSSFILGLLFFTTSSFRSMLWLPLTAQKEENLPNRPIYGVIDQPVFLDGSPRTLAPQSVQALDSFIDWSLVTFQSYRDGNWEIYFIDGSAWSEKRLTSNGASDVDPRLNRAGNRIVFSSNRTRNYKLFSMNTDSSGLIQITSNASNDINPFWSPDGAQITFETDRDKQAEVYKMNSDGSNLTRLTTSNDYDGMPVWSPDGTKISFISHRTGTYRLYVMNTDGSGVVQLSNQPYSAYPSWSPDGSQIAYAADGDNDGWLELWLMNADGSNQRQIYKPSDQYVDVWPRSWSQDGRYIGTTTIYYVYRQNKWYWTNAFAGLYDTIGNNETSLTIGNMDQNPDIRSTDLVPPTSKVDPLPAYSRASSFPVHWSGFDDKSGVESYDLQFRISPSDVWNNWYVNTTNITGTFPLISPGEELFFRSRAHDKAGNTESWHTTSGDTWTKLFTWLFEGIISDNRGKPIPNSNTGISPTPWEQTQTDYYGKFLFHLITQGSYTLNAAHAGYGTLPTVTLPINSDSSFGLQLPPQDDLIKNGGFESGNLGSWQITGTLQANIDNSQVHSGNASVILGGLIPVQPVNLSNSPGQSGFWGRPLIARDTQGRMHAVWYEMSLPGLVYSQQQSNGTWTSPTLICNGINPNLAVGPDDSLHLVSIAGGYSPVVNVSYSTKPWNGNWSAPIDISGPFANAYENGTATIAVDTLGDIHVMWADANYGLRYVTKPVGGSWSVPIQIFASGKDPMLAIGNDNQLHLVWRDGWNLLYSNRPHNGSWSEPIRISNDATGYQTENLIVDSVGNVHVSWVTTYQDAFKYAWKSPSGNWSTPSLISEETNSDLILTGEISVGSGGYLQSVWSTYSGKMYYRIRYPDGLWSMPVMIREKGISSPGIWADENGLAQIVWSEDNPDYMNTDIFYSSLLIPEIMSVNMSQMIHIPIEMNKPTLSFAYRLDPYNGTSAYLDVSINNSQLLTITTTSQNWAYEWFDLSSWSGQTITLTVSNYGTSTRGSFIAHLDEISLGSWSTPLVNNVLPYQLDVWDSKIITITGDNFITTPTIYLDANSVTNVVILNEHTLFVTLPDSLAPGIYDVWVENPGGQRGVFPGGLRLGKPIFLPLTMR